MKENKKAQIVANIWEILNGSKRFGIPINAAFTPNKKDEIYGQ